MSNKATIDSSAGIQPTSAVRYIGFTLVAATGAASAAYSSTLLGLEIWMMFVGWVVYYTNPSSIYQGVASFLCLIAGLAAGCVAAIAFTRLGPIFGDFAIAMIVFSIAIVVVSMRGVKVLDNITAWFLGLIAFFAAHLEPTLLSIFELGCAAALGCVAGWVTQGLQAKLLGSGVPA